METSIRHADADFREAYGHHKDMLYRFAWRMTGSPAAAEDLVQDCFVAILRNSAVFDQQVDDDD